MTMFDLLLSQTLDFLMILAQDGIRVEEARRRLQALEHSYPGTKMDLLWEEEAYDRSLHYDVLSHLPEGGTISLSFCPDRALPWPMRGVQRWNEYDLARINGTTLTVEHAISCLDCIWEEQSLRERLIHYCLIQDALLKNSLTLSHDELQHAMDGFRRARKLLTPQNTYRWMEQRGMSHEQFEQYVTDEALLAKLRDTLTKTQVESYFAQHHADFDVAQIAQIDFPDLHSAKLAYQRISQGETSFYEAAQHAFFDLRVASPPQSTALFKCVQRRQLALELAQAIFTAHTGDLLPPLQTPEGCCLITIFSLMTAQLDEKVHKLIQETLFTAWLTEQQQHATIEWYWGNKKRTEAS